MCESRGLRRKLKVPLLTLVKSVIIKYLTLYLSSQRQITIEKTLANFFGEEFNVYIFTEKENCCMNILHGREREGEEEKSFMSCSPSPIHRTDI